MRRLSYKDELVDYLLGLLDVPNKALNTPNTKAFLRQFKDVLMKKGWKCFIRSSMGKDIEASCGMLSIKN